MPRRTESFARVDRAVVAAAVGALLTTAVLIGPALRPGYGLYLDHVAVPDPAQPTWNQIVTNSGLRSWPLDGVRWVWSLLLPTWLFQHLILVASIGGASLGAGMVLRRWGWSAALSASVLAAANPYAVERLLLGQPVLLLGYAAIPWIIVGSRQRTPIRRLGVVTAASFPAALTPWGGLVSAMMAVGAVLARRRTAKELFGQVALSTLLWLPWLLPALVGGQGTADPNGARAFRLADELGVGTFLSGLVGAGVWSPAAGILSNRWVAGVAVAALLGIAGFGGWQLMQHIHGRPAAAVLGAAVGFPALAAVLSGPLLQWWADRQLDPGWALFRDLHRTLAPSAFALIILGAIGIQGLIGGLARGLQAPSVVLGVILPVSLAVMLVPTAPPRLHTSYAPAPFSTEWSEAMAAIDDEGQVLTLPWQPLRRVEWAQSTFLDPTSVALGDRVLADHTLSVDRDEGTVLVREVTNEIPDTLLQYLTGTVAEPVPSGLLASSGVTQVLVWLDSRGFVPSLPEGWEVTFSGSDFEVWSLSTP